MKTIVYREFRAPNMEHRRHVLEELVKLRNYPELKDLKKYFRTELRKTEGHVFYYIYHRGLKYLLGEQNQKYKYIIPILDSEQIASSLKKFRKERSHIKKIHKSHVLYSHSIRVDYEKIGSTIAEPDTFKNATKIIRKKTALKAKSPLKTDKDSYVGIELEYASSLSIEQWAERIAEAGLQEKVRVMRDGSIVVTDNFPHRVEFCVLTKYSQFDQTLKELVKILDPNLLRTNETCGFHVHLDARNSDVKKMFYNLVCMQNLLFKLSAMFRQGNRYCKPVQSPDFDQIDPHAPNAHWDAISKFSYLKHQTIEIRIHESTIDLTLVSKWVKLLKTIAEYSGEKLKFGTWDTTLKQIDKLQLSEELTKYLQEKQVG